MLELDKSKVDFLVTTNMVNEVRHVIDFDFKQVDSIVDEMFKRGLKRVYFVACGSPLCACQTAKQLFDKYCTVPCEVYSGWDFLDSTPAVLDKNCLVIGVSHYGKTEEVSSSIELARKKGALTVGVTCKPTGSPLSGAAEHVIAYGAECIWEVHLLIAYRFALDIIRAVSPCEDAKAIENDILKLPEVLAELVETAEASSKELGIRASAWPLIYTVAAGPLLPLAYKEGVITMLEFTWTDGSSINAAEFRHGPLEVTDENHNYVILLGTDQSRHTTERVWNFVKRYTKNVITFDYRAFSHGLHPMLSPMVLFVPLEYFYYYLSISKDHNPDDRRYYGGLVEF